MAPVSGLGYLDIVSFLMLSKKNIKSVKLTDETLTSQTDILGHYQTYEV